MPNVCEKHEYHPFSTYYFFSSNSSHSVPVLDKSIPATGYHLWRLVRMPQASDANCVVCFELAVGQKQQNLTKNVALFGK